MDQITLDLSGYINQTDTELLKYDQVKESSSLKYKYEGYFLFVDPLSFIPEWGHSSFKVKEKM